MKKNFRAIDIAIIKFDDIEIDLHNELLLSRINIVAADSRLDILWISEKKDNKIFVMIFRDVSRYIVFSPNFVNKGDDARTLDSIGYLSPDEFGKSDVFMTEKDFEDDSHIILSFVDDSYVSVEADICLVGYVENVVSHIA